MPLYEYRCMTCEKTFEGIVNSPDASSEPCPHCRAENAERLVPKFRVGGRGDLRESTDHGCHGPVYDPHHSHDHKSVPSQGSGGESDS